MTARPISTRQWHSYGTGPLPSSADALEEPFTAFPSWFLWITCDRCGGRAGKAELLTGIEGVGSRPA